MNKIAIIGGSEFLLPVLYRATGCGNFELLTATLKSLKKNINLIPFLLSMREPV